MKIHLRQRKQVNLDKTGKKQNFKISLYLEIYKGTTKKPDGKIKVLRDYKYLNLYLIDKPTTPIEKQHNKDILQLANAIKAKTELEIKNNEYGFNRSKSSVYFDKYMDKQANLRFGRSKENWIKAKRNFINFAGENILISDITTEVCEGFKDYLLKCTYSKKNKKLSHNTIAFYISLINSALNAAVKEKLIKENPFKNVENVKKVGSIKEYLTFEELQKLAKTYCSNSVLKRAFLFSCLTGLRWSDIEKLKWSNMQGNILALHQKKTKETIYVNVPSQTLVLLGKKGEPNEKIFDGLIRYSNYMTLTLQNWIQKSGINKKITFHCGRHTYAVNQLFFGTDIYTVSKLLGHTSIKTTEIYAKIVDAKKVEAANIIPDIGVKI